MNIPKLAIDNTFHRENGTVLKTNFIQPFYIGDTVGDKQVFFEPTVTWASSTPRVTIGATPKPESRVDVWLGRAVKVAALCVGAAFIWGKVRR